MLFEHGDTVFESEKERNFYTKFFAGYFFNELIGGYQNRLKHFWDVLSMCGCNCPDARRKTSVELRSEKEILVVQQGKKAEPKHIPRCIQAESVHVSFDNHAYLLGIVGDNGEFADVVVYDNPSLSTVVALEVKYLEDYDPEKDVCANVNRIRLISEKMANTLFIPCLLISKVKWDRSHSPTQESAYAGTNILFWEQLMTGCDNQHIEEYFRYHLSFLNPKSKRKSDVCYEIVGGKWKRKPTGH